MRLLHSAAAVALLVVACGVPSTEVATTTSRPVSDPVPAGTALEDLAEARRLWSEAGLDSYRFEFEDDCGECDPPYRLPHQVVVWEGEASAIHQPTVETLFSQVDGAIRDGRTVEVAYHPEFGYPTEIAIDMEARAYDGGTHWLVRALQPGLPGDDISLAALEDARRVWEDRRPPAYEFRTSIGCDCPLAGSIWARVDGRLILDWDVQFDDGTGDRISPITVDDMFEDLSSMLSSSDGVVTEGVRITGSAVYHQELGYPVWVGLDIEVLDPSSDLASLSPRIVFSVHDLEPIEGVDAPAGPLDFEQARERWLAAGLTDYEYQMTVHDIESASFSEPYTVTVADGSVVAVEFQGAQVDEVEGPTSTIDDLFTLVAERIADGATANGIYDEALGYPVFLAIFEPNSSSTSLVISIDALTPRSEDRA